MPHHDLVVGQILLELRFFPFEIDNLIIEYQQARPGTLQKEFGNFYYAKGITVDEKYIYVLDEGFNNKDTKIYIFDKNTFEHVNIYEYGGEGWDVAVDSNYLYITKGREHLILVANKFDGEIIRKITCSRDPTCITMDDNRLYITEFDNSCIFVLNKEDFAPLFRTIKQANSAIAIDDKFMYSNDTSNNFYKIKKDNGKILSKYELFKSIPRIFGLIISDDFLYVANNKEIIIKINKNNYEPIKEFKIDTVIKSSDVYLAVDDSYIYATDLKTVKIFAK